MEPRTPSPGGYRQLDGLRGVGAFSFLYFHFLASLPINQPWLPTGFALHWTYFTCLMLQMFFAVSAFILFGSLDRIREEGGGAHANVIGAFFTRRFFRIVPLWWLVLTIEWARRQFGVDVYVANATFAFGFLFYDARWLPIGVAWTLFVEETFYAMVPGLYRWIRGIFSSAVLFLVMVFVARLWHKAARVLEIPDTNFFVQDFPFSYFKYFAVGILVRFLHPQVSARWAPWLDVAALLGVTATVIDLRWGTPAVFFLLLAVVTPGSRLGRWLTVAPLVFVGVRCYFVYITHDQLFIEPVLIYVLPLLTRSPLAALGSWVPMGLAFVLAVAACLGAASLSMRWFELPLIRLGKRLSSRVLHGGRQPAAPRAEIA